MNHIVFLLKKDKQNNSQYRESEAKINSENETHNVMPQLQFSIPSKIFFISSSYGDRLLHTTLKDRRLQGNFSPFPFY